MKKANSPKGGHTHSVHSQTKVGNGGDRPCVWTRRSMKERGVVLEAGMRVYDEKIRPLRVCVCVCFKGTLFTPRRLYA
jgi:hypothetical protein